MQAAGFFFEWVWTFPPHGGGAEDGPGPYSIIGSGTRLETEILDSAAKAEQIFIYLSWMLDMLESEFTVPIILSLSETLLSECDCS